MLHFILVFVSVLLCYSFFVMHLPSHVIHVPNIKMSSHAPNKFHRLNLQIYRWSEHVWLIFTPMQYSFLTFELCLFHFRYASPSSSAASLSSVSLSMILAPSLRTLVGWRTPQEVSRKSSTSRLGGIQPTNPGTNELATRHCEWNRLCGYRKCLKVYNAFVFKNKTYSVIISLEAVKYLYMC